MIFSHVLSVSVVLRVREWFSRALSVSVREWFQHEWSVSVSECFDMDSHFSQRVVLTWIVCFSQRQDLT